MKEKRVQMKRCFKRNLLLSLGLMVLFCVAGVVQAAQPPQPPPPRFQEVAGSNGSIIRDNNTGLEWQRCAYGLSWTGSGCSGAAWEGTWEDAVRITAPGGFRLPTIDELKTLHSYDRSIFPGAKLNEFWSSSPDANDIHCAWFFNFYDGSVTSYGKGDRNLVRLVRGGQ